MPPKSKAARDAEKLEQRKARLGLVVDLDALLPPNVGFMFRGTLYEIPGDTSIDTIIEALQLREAFQQAEKSDDEDGLTRAAEGMRAIVHELLDEGGSLDGPYPRLGIESVTNVLTLALGYDPAQDTLDAALADVLVGDADDPVAPADEGAADDPPPAAADTAAA